ncbi:uncharacterized protein TNCT_356201 [Trichonephila clavata]|uniref:Uncharacterized protein n=1 Tax=Trichonephila clavata TaxID=2740835 RepID=A0A8X6FH11_TRICU|nr:uncharacterized protein TNCT_356201 [Trichonephila clavata]
MVTNNKNTQGKQDKANYKLDGKCLPCYQKNLSPSEDRKQIHVHNSISAPLQTDKILEASREPKWVSKLENINPNLFRRDDYTDSTNKNSSSSNVILSTSDKQPLSETKESFQKTQDLLPEAKAAEQKAMTAVPRKAKSSADFVSPKVGEFPFTKESYLLSQIFIILLREMPTWAIVHI